ncbi:glycosyltransferase family 4 protein [Mucilaginibacter kameinonensis]|uniref:glycosyltransferase family 4 protein n=1 Tax=Mucilaginibacter kameinonensis TaxID=452286 RepID=UPI000EF84003|nr:glycosyltransferase family 4 protein [Mucilaginibacter kameinonensis]
MVAKNFKKISIIDHTGVKAGLAKYSTSLAESLSKLDYDVDVFSNFSTSEESNVKYFKYFEAEKSGVIRRFLLRIYGYLRSALKSGKHTEYIFIHLFELTLISFLQHLICYLFGHGRIITIYHDIDSFGKTDVKSYAKLILKKMSRYIIVHNEFSKKELIRLFPYVEPGKVIIMKHGHYKDHTFDVESAPEGIVDAQAMRESGCRVLLFFGQIKEEKGLDILVKAMSDLPDNVHLIIAGNPVIDFRPYEQMIQNLNLDKQITKYLRFIEDDEMNYLIRQVDIVVLPYKKIYQSGVLLNVMSQNSLVMASDLEPNKDIIEDGVNGFLFKSESVDDLINKATKILSFDEQLLNEIRENAFNTVTDHYDWDQIIASLIQNLKIRNYDTTQRTS